MTTENRTNVLDDLVGEGKKFVTVEDLVKKIEHADAFIETLKSENATLRDELSKAVTSGDRKALLEKLMANLTNGTTDDGVTTPDQPQNKQDNPVKSLSHDDVVKILEQRAAAEQAQRNLAQALEPVKKVYGDKTKETLTAKAAELGLSLDELEAIGKKSPQAFQAIVGISRDSTTRSMTIHGSKNTATTGGESNVVRNKAYYDALKKEMGIQKFVLDSKLQIQMHKDRMALGDDWD